MQNVTYEKPRTLVFPRLIALCVAIFASGLVSNTAATGTISPSTTLTSSSDQACSKSVQNGAQAIESSLNRAAARRLAESSKEFSSIAPGYSKTFNSIFNLWATDAYCQVSWESVNVVFTISTQDGSLANLIFTESLNLSSVLKVSIQGSGTFGYTNQQQGKWAGYEFWGSGNAQSVPVYFSEATWSLPQVNAPWWSACWTNCNMAQWTGLTHDSGGAPTTSCPNGCIVQTGVQSRVLCAAFCIHTAFAWYEFLPQGFVSCFWVNDGDSVAAEAYSGAYFGGDPNFYTAYFYDNTIAQGCSAQQQRNDMGTSYYAQMVIERTTLLPSFSDFYMAGWMYYGGIFHSIYDPYTQGLGHNGWWTQLSLNCHPLGDNNNNVDALGGVNSNGQFTFNYHNSDYTDNCRRQ